MASAAGKKRAETLRLKRIATLEQQIREQGFDRVAGVDEAGRGPLAGPVVAAACILPEGVLVRGINDSKKISKPERFHCYQELIQIPGIWFGVGVVEAEAIDRLNIHQATLLAMRLAVEDLGIAPDFLLIDGKHCFETEIPSEAVVGGDEHVQAIAAASILAKVTRDQIMLGYEELFPGYGFERHKGYGTKEHLAALSRLGPTPIHRLSYGKVGEKK